MSRTFDITDHTIRTIFWKQGKPHYGIPCVSTDWKRVWSDFLFKVSSCNVDSMRMIFELETPSLRSMLHWDKENGFSILADTEGKFDYGEDLPDSAKIVVKISIPDGRLERIQVIGPLTCFMNELHFLHLILVSSEEGGSAISFRKTPENELIVSSTREYQD